MSKNRAFPLRVQEELCVGCGLCASSCAYQAIEMGDYPVIDADRCRLCGSCVQSCPVGALEMDEVAPAAEAPQQETSGIWVLAEVENGALAPVSRELLGKAVALSAKLRQPVEAVLVGGRIAALAQELIACGADRVHVVEAPALGQFVEENYARVLADLAGRLHPDILLVGATQRGRGLSARLAALLHTGLTADCTELDIDTESGLLHQIRPAFGGNLMATIVNPTHRPQMASVRPGVMKALEADAARKGEVVRHDYSAFAMDSRVSVLNETAEAAGGDSLEGSHIIIGIGRGVKDKACVAEIRRLADRIGAAVAGSRAAVEAGLVDASVQVGQTGHTVAPDLYIAIGISGQIQHTAAITGARTIIAVNPDRTAPIFSVADYGLALPVEEALPQLMNLIPAVV